MQDMVSSIVCFVSRLGIYTADKATVSFIIVLRIVVGYKVLLKIRINDIMFIKIKLTI